MEIVMTLETLAWLGMAAYAAHILEEYTLDWRNWSRAILGLPVEWSDFYVTNAVVMALGIAQAMLARTLPVAVLAFAGLMLINGFFMHVVQMIRTKGRFSPGVITAVVFFLPLGSATYNHAIENGLADIRIAAAGLVLGGLTLAFPIGMLLIKSRPYFRQDPTKI
jgi:hypothetical protein